MSGSATHHHEHDHIHAESPSLLGGHDHDYSRAGRRSLIAALVLLLVHMVADIIGGVLSGSLSLLAHAGHMVTDAGALVVALAALHYELPASTERTFGLRRLEVLAALFNVILLWTVAGTILLQVFEVVGHGHAHGNENLGTYLLAIGALGIVIHLTSAFILHRSQHHSVSVEGAFRHVSVHAVESVAIIVSGILVTLFHWHFLDWALSLVIVLVILFSTYRLVVKIIKVLLQAVPDDVDVYRLCNALEDVPGVTFIHGRARLGARAPVQRADRPRHHRSRQHGRGSDAHPHGDVEDRAGGIRNPAHYVPAGIFGRGLPRGKPSRRPFDGVVAGGSPRTIGSQARVKGGERPTPPGQVRLVQWPLADRRPRFACDLRVPYPVQANPC